MNIVADIAVKTALTAGKKVAANMGIKFGTSLASSLVGYKVCNSISKKEYKKINKDTTEEQRDAIVTKANVKGSFGSAGVAALCCGICCIATNAINKLN